MKEVLEKINNQVNLSMIEMQDAMNQIMSGKVNDIDMESFLIGLNTKGISEEEITAEVTKMQAEFDALEWARNRASEYPPMDEQLDQLYHDIDAGKFGADAKTGSWFVGITSVKNAYPKP